MGACAGSQGSQHNEPVLEYCTRKKEKPCSGKCEKAFWDSFMVGRAELCVVPSGSSTAAPPPSPASDGCRCGRVASSSTRCRLAADMAQGWSKASTDTDKEQTQKPRDARTEWRSQEAIAWHRAFGSPSLDFPAPLSIKIKLFEAKTCGPPQRRRRLPVLLPGGVSTCPDAARLLVDRAAAGAGAAPRWACESQCTHPIHPSCT